MKRLAIIMFAVFLAVSATACGGSAEEAQDAPEYEIAMITESETVSIDDEGNTQRAWEGLRRYAEEHEKSFKYYEPEEDSDDGRLMQIDQATEAGASVIVCCGDAFEKVIGAAQRQYESVTFLYVDGKPVDDQGKTDIAENCVSITFDELQAGYMAGYSAVTEGYSELGFMAESNDSPMKRYGYGFLQGANQAASEKGWYVDISYKYFEKGERAADVQREAEAWYQDGTAIIFSCGDSIFDSVAVEADIARADVFAAGQVNNSTKNILATVVKEYGNGVYQQLEAFYEGELQKGKTVVFGIREKGISISMDKSRYEVFSQEDYQALCRQLSAKRVKLMKPADAKSVNRLIEKKNLHSIEVTVK